MKIKNFNPYSRDILMNAAFHYLEMSEKRFKDRIDQFAAIGESIIKDEEDNRQVPPYILRAIHLGDKRSIRKWNRRRK